MTPFDTPWAVIGGHCWETPAPPLLHLCVEGWGEIIVHDKLRAGTGAASEPRPPIPTTAHPVTPIPSDGKRLV
jgi:hypothetical protein